MKLIETIYSHWNNTGKFVIVTGDFNVVHKRIDVWKKPDENASCFTLFERHSFDKYLRMGFSDTFRELNPTEVNFTKWNTTSLRMRPLNLGFRLDYILAWKELMPAITSSEIHNLFKGSDHWPILLRVNTKELHNLVKAKNELHV